MKKIARPIIALCSSILVACGDGKVAENGSPTESTIKDVLFKKVDEVNTKLKEQNTSMSFVLNSIKLESCSDANANQEFVCQVAIDGKMKMGEKEKSEKKTSSVTFKKEADTWTVKGFL